jgi:hypothetical protein
VAVPTAANTDTTLGFRVKSGLAVAVLLKGPAQSPQVLDRRFIDLCDPDIPGSRQPYHAGMGMLQTDTAKVERLRKVVSRVAQQSVTTLLKDYREAGHRIRAAGLVVGSETDPAKITNPHIRAHALEGRLFRTVLEEALRLCEVASSIFLERNIYQQAAKKLGTSEEALRLQVTKLGRELDGPWRADEKTASLAAWLALDR